MTFPELVTMGEATLARYAPGDGEVCISIRSPGAPLPPVPDGFAHVLRLLFADDCFDGWELRPHTITPSDADRVIAFVEQHRSTARRIVIHCAVGASRSVSMALALCRAYDEPRAYANPPKPLLEERRRRGAGWIPNRGVYCRVLDAYERHVRATAATA